jgi:hypothetical protein
MTRSVCLSPGQVIADPARLEELDLAVLDY